MMRIVLISFSCCGLHVARVALQRIHRRVNVSEGSSDRPRRKGDVIAAGCNFVLRMYARQDRKAHIRLDSVIDRIHRMHVKMNTVRNDKFLCIDSLYAYWI